MTHEDLRRPWIERTPLALLIIVPIALAIFLMTVRRDEMKNAFGLGLEAAARTTARRVDQALGHLMQDVEGVAAAPHLVWAVEAPEDRDSLGVARIDSAWGTDEDTVGPALRGTELSRWLATLVERHAVYEEIILADAHGRLVAASGMTSDYDQKGEEWFDDAMKCLPGSRPCTNLEGVELDASVAATGFVITATVMSRDAKAIGVVKAVMGPADVVTALQAVGITSPARAYLLDSVAEVILDGGGDEVAERAFFAANAVMDKSGVNDTAIRPKEFQFEAMSDGSRYVIGASVGRISRANPAWTVAVAEPANLMRDYGKVALWYIVALIGLAAFAFGALAVHFTSKGTESLLRSEPSRAPGDAWDAFTSGR